MSFAQGKLGARAIPLLLGPYLSIQDVSSLAQTSRRRAIDGIIQPKIKSILAMLDSVPINTDDYSDFDPKYRVDEDSTVTLREYIYNFTLEQSFSYFQRDIDQDGRNRRERQKYKLLFLIIKMLYRNKIINFSLDLKPDPLLPPVPEGFSKLDYVIRLMIEDGVDLPFPLPEPLKTVRLVLKLAAGIMPDTTASQRIREDIDREEEEEEMGGAGSGEGGAEAGEGGAEAGVGGAGGARRSGSSSSGGGSKRPRSESFLEGGKTFFTFY
jgi:hypothetical protein